MIDNNVSLQEHTQAADLDDTVQFYTSGREHHGINIESYFSFALQVTSENLKEDEINPQTLWLNIKLYISYLVTNIYPKNIKVFEKYEIIRKNK